jgi:hypothetical protein
MIVRNDPTQPTFIKPTDNKTVDNKVKSTAILDFVCNLVDPPHTPT